MKLLDVCVNWLMPTLKKQNCSLLNLLVFYVFGFFFFFPIERQSLSLILGSVNRFLSQCPYTVLLLTTLDCDEVLVITSLTFRCCFWPMCSGLQEFRHEKLVCLKRQQLFIQGPSLRLCHIDSTVTPCHCIWTVCLAQKLKIRQASPIIETMLTVFHIAAALKQYL